MKKTLLSLLFLLSFIYGFGQHAANVKKTAMGMLKASEQKDYNAYVSYFYPAEAKFRGGKEKWIQQMKTNDRDSKLYGISRGKQALGAISKIYKAGKELHCTIESNTRYKSYVNRSHFLAISGDQGRTWKFIMTGGKTPSDVWAMVPKFNGDLTWVDFIEEV
jgi:hypothetical protein